MDKGIEHVGLSRAWMAAFALLATLGVAVAVIGAREGRAHLLFGGSMFVVIALTGVLYLSARRPSRDDSLPSHAETAAWSMIGMGLAAMMVLGGVPLGSTHGRMGGYLLFATCAVLVACYPGFRRRFVEERRGYREITDDERERAIRAQGEYLSKRLLELAMVALAVAWVFWPAPFRALGGPPQVASLLLLPIMLANVVGESRVAWLHWRDRQ